MSLKAVLGEMSVTEPICACTSTVHMQVYFERKHEFVLEIFRVGYQCSLSGVLTDIVKASHSFVVLSQTCTTLNGDVVLQVPAAKNSCGSSPYC